MVRDVCALVLAAGLGSRFRKIAGPDRNKLCTPCIGRDGVERLVLDHVLSSIRGHVSRVLVVTRPEYADVIGLVRDAGCEPVLVASPGLGDSLCAGVRQAADAGGWLVTLGDMPFVLPSTVERVIRAMRPEGISVPLHQGRYGHPVGFGRQSFADLAGLSGDKGARRLFSEGRVVEVPVNDAGTAWDVDVPASLHFDG